MVNIPNVHGSAAQAIPLIIGVDTVYVHKNIREEQKTDDLGNSYTDYVYDETQYDLREYIQLQINEQNQLQEKLDTAELAVIELYELMG